MIFIHFSLQILTSVRATRVGMVVAALRPPACSYVSVYLVIPDSIANLVSSHGDTSDDVTFFFARRQLRMIHDKMKRSLESA